MTAVVLPRTVRGWLAGVAALALAVLAVLFVPAIWRWAPLLTADRPDPVCGRNSGVARVVGAAGFGLVAALVLGVPTASAWSFVTGRRRTAVAVGAVALCLAAWWRDVAPKLVNHGCF